MSVDESKDNPNQQIPEWINEQYFDDILKKEEPDHTKILKFNAVAAIPPGENFASVMVRVLMILEMKDGSTKPISYILKTSMDYERGGALIKELHFFIKEKYMYQRYIPEFEALYKEAGRDIQFAPKCLHTETTDERINIVFEDLKLKNFQNSDRLKGYDMKHMRRVLQKLAELHAASAVWQERNGNFAPEFQYGFLKGQSDRACQEQLFRVKMRALKEAMPTWGLQELEKYLSKLPTSEQFFNCGFRNLKTDPNEFNVLNHGDFWSSNIMLNYLSSGEINELLFVDYQTCKWGSPVQDLVFLIIISAAQDIRVKEYDNFVEIYHEHLIDCLNVLKYKKPLPKLRELQMAMYKENNMFYAFFALFNHLNAIVLPTDKDSCIHSLMRDDDFGHAFRLRSYTSPIFVKAALDLFPFYHHRGLYDFEAFK